MAQSPLVRFLLLKYVLLLFISTCLCQRDCTGVDCPVLDNCIEEVLENGACCATCAQTGCMCEGYQFYDCVAAGFRKGKVPEGESYFVDFGSTECSCPEGGGRISCHFIPCPEIPANCIEVSEPADGCVHCERVGCVHEEQKYEAGHSFHMDPCQVCHCPNDGGKLMCYPIPDCDPQNVQKPILATTTEENTPEKHNDPIQYIFSQQGPREHLSKPFQASHHDSLPPFKLNPSHMDEEDDYDYSPTDASEPSLHDLTSPTESSIISVSHSENYTPHEATIHRGAKQELRERFGIQEASTDTPTHKDRTDQNRFSIHRDGTLNFHEDITSRGRFAIHRGNRERERFDVHKDITNVEMPAIEEGNRESEKLSVPKETTTIETSDIPEDATNSIAVIDSPPTEPPTTPQFLEETTPVLLTTEKSVSESPIYPHTVETVEQDNTTVDNKKQIIPLKNITGHDGKHGHGLVSHDRKHLPQNAGGNTLSSADDVRENIRLPGGDHGKPSKEHKLERKHERHMFPVVKFSPSSQPPLRVKADEGHPPNKQSQSLLNFRTEEEEEREERDNTLSSFPKAHKAFSVVPDPALLENCCEKGKKWASENQHCNHMSVTTEEQTSVCSAVQKQCCLGSLREDLCLTGVKAAKAGEMCEEQDNQHCVENSQKECCSCCALGLHFRREGRGCEAHQYLLYPCGHVFLTCCEEEEEGEVVFGAPTLRKKERPRPTAIPQKVLDSKFLKEAFSISASEDAANSVEDLEDVDECQRHEGRLCSHTCINTWGSYKCTCHAGYKLQQDGQTCVPESPEEENRVREDNRPVTVPVPQQETAKELSSVLNPCEGNSLCMHRCSVVGGRARCSCFPGFSLMADGHTCEDVDECKGGTHNCSSGEFCVNQDGSFQCVHLNELCDEGFILNPDRECVDVNECVTNTHTCQANERCVNTIGAFMCERQISCPAGYQLRNGVCEDIDECMVRTHNCSAGFECQNTDGSFHCSPKQRCLTGFTQDAHGNCVDINECTSVSEPCRAGFNCINTVGSYTCQRKIIICGQGYHSSPDGTRCIDVDECQTGIHRCGEGQICHNLPGSYRCDCQTGYQYDAIRQLCLDVNECWRYPGRLCAQTCENTPGSYQCSCTAGFSLAFDGKNCEDVNECDNNPCSQECANIYGSYQCYCRQGFYLKEDGHTCEDIDECSQSIGHLCAFQCVNVPGSYTCACPTHGYSMSPNGRTCRDIDECAIGAHNCSAGQTCYNIQGSFRCLSFTCPENYRKVSDTRCERVGCPNFQDCQNMPLRITYYQLSFQTNIVIPAQIFRIGPSPAYSGDNIIISIPRGNEEGYFSTRRLNSFTGAVYLQRQVREPRDFFIDVEMKLLRQGTFTTFLARIYVFITANSL